MNTHIKKQTAFDASQVTTPYVVLEGSDVMHFSTVNLPIDPSMRVDSNEVMIIFNPSQEVKNAYNGDYGWESFDGLAYLAGFEESSSNADLEITCYQDDIQIDPTTEFLNSYTYTVYRLDPTKSTTVRFKFASTINFDGYTEFALFPVKDYEYYTEIPYRDREQLAAYINKQVIGSDLKSAIYDSEYRYSYK